MTLHSGDLGRIDRDGNVFFVGRRKEAIRRRGENISAFEVEEGVALHKDVIEAAAVGVPSDLTEEEVKVFVVRRPGTRLDAEKLIAHCEHALARFQVPRYVEFGLPAQDTHREDRQVLPQGTLADLFHMGPRKRGGRGLT